MGSVLAEAMHSDRLNTSSNPTFDLDFFGGGSFSTNHHAEYVTPRRLLACMGRKKARKKTLPTKADVVFQVMQMGWQGACVLF